jgi:hypothetical protein
VKKLGGITAAGGASLVAISLLLAPALAATTQPGEKKTRSAPSLRVGGFTPAVADPRLAAELAKRGLPSGSFRFTPTTASRDKSKDVKVAVRARASTTAEAVRNIGGATAGTVTAITPTAYNLGVSVGWKRFAISGDIAKVNGGVLPGATEAAEVGVSYTGKNFEGRVMVGAQRNEGMASHILPQEESYSLDVGGSYSITQNLDLTGGFVNNMVRDGLEPVADERRDSLAFYIGTAFLF